MRKVGMEFMLNCRLHRLFLRESRNPTPPPPTPPPRNTVWLVSGPIADIVILVQSVQIKVAIGRRQGEGNRRLSCK